MSLSVQLIAFVDELTPHHLERWNELAAHGLQRWEWLGSWWSAYQRNLSLYVLCVKRGEEIIGFAPWVLEHRVSTGKTVQFMGSGKACTDHLSLLVAEEDTAEFCEAIVQWLIEVGTDANQISPRLVWDAIELIGVDQDDTRVNCFCDVLQSQNVSVEQNEGMGCYIIDLPATWDEYVKMRSKSGRREIRQSLKRIDESIIVVNHIQTEQELAEFWDQFVVLHQRRRHESGTDGCFDHPPFGQFLRTAASRLLEAGLLRFVVASLDGIPVAAQFAIVDEENWFFYQSGMEPDASHMRPGLGIFCHAIRETINSGRTRFDMMRGDEPYKKRWRAELKPAQEVIVCSPRLSAKIRRQVCTASSGLKRLIKSSLGMNEKD